MALFGGFGKLLTGIHGLASLGTLGLLSLFFLRAGAFVFGSGLAIVPFLYGGVVVKFHWLTERQFVDAVAVAMITPGPVVITAAFIGYLVAGVLGATAAALAVFAPPLSDRSLWSSVLSSVRPKPPGEGLRARSHLGCRRCNCGSGIYSRPTFSVRCADGADWACIARDSVARKKSARAGGDSRSWCGRNCSARIGSLNAFLGPSNTR
jgi:hypothetical protein